MLSDSMTKKEEYVLDEYENEDNVSTKRRALIFFANRSKLESLRFFIV